MDNSDIKIEWSEVKSVEPDYSKFSLGLQQDIKTISSSISYIRFLLNAISEIVDTDRGKKLFAKYSILSLIKHAFFYQAIIESHKLFNKKDVLSFPKLLNEMTNSYRKIIWYDPLSLEDIESLKTNLFLENIQPAFSKVKTIRDEYLAHNNRQPEEVNFTLDDLEILQKKAEELSNIIGNALYGTSTAYDLQDDISLPSMFYQMEVFQMYRETISAARKDALPTIETKLLYNILKGK